VANPQTGATITSLSSGGTYGMAAASAQYFGSTNNGTTWTRRARLYNAATGANGLIGVGGSIYYAAAYQPTSSIQPSSPNAILSSPDLVTWTQVSTVHYPDSLEGLANLQYINENLIGSSASAGNNNSCDGIQISNTTSKLLFSSGTMRVI
jgi:hypothetical protein